MNLTKIAVAFLVLSIAVLSECAPKRKSRVKQEIKAAVDKYNIFQITDFFSIPCNLLIICFMDSTHYCCKTSQPLQYIPKTRLISFTSQRAENYRCG